MTSVDDDGESVKLGLGSLPDRCDQGQRRTESTISISDDDDPDGVGELRGWPPTARLRATRSTVVVQLHGGS